MTDSDRIPDAAADVQQRAAATEDYGGVPISEQELAQVWTTGEAADRPADTAAPDTGDDTVASPDAGESGDLKPEVPADDPEPVEPA